MSRIFLTILPLLLPLYTVRFRIGPIPTTLLEVVLLGMIGVWIFLSLRPFLSSRAKSRDLLVSDSDPNRSLHSSSDSLVGMTKSVWFLPILLWLIAGLVGVFVAENHIAGFGLWRAYFLEPVLVFLMLRALVKTDDDKRALLRSSCALIIFLAVWAILQITDLLPIPSPWHMPPQGLRATGPFPFPNALALFVVPFAALFFHYAITPPASSYLKRRTLFVGFFAGLVATALAKSDGGLIAFAAAAFISLVLQKQTRKYAIVAAVFGGIAIFAIPTTRDIAIKQLLFKEWSGKVRLVMWGETKTMFFDRPILGAGLGNFPNAIKPYHKATWMEIFQYPHNILLNLWSEVGLLGILAFGWILVTWIRYGRLAVFPVLVAILVHGLVDVPYFKNDLAIAFWMLVILTINLEQQPTTSIGKTKKPFHLFPKRSSARG